MYINKDLIGKYMVRRGQNTNKGSENHYLILDIWYDRPHNIVQTDLWNIVKAEKTRLRWDVDNFVKFQTNQTLDIYLWIYTIEN